MTNAHSSDLTRNQSLVLDALTQAKGPLSAYGLLDALRGDGLRSPPQIYRALEKLMMYGLIHRVESLNAFVACAHRHEPDNTGPVAFAICDRCESVREFSSGGVADQLGEWSSANAFRLRRMTIELRGLCSACSDLGSAHRTGADIRSHDC